MEYPVSFIADNTDFRAFGFEHMTWLIGYGIVFTAAWIWYGRQQKTPEAQQKIGFYHGIFGVVTWTLMSVVIYQVRGWYISSHLPFHVCYMMNIVLPFMHYYRSKKIFNVAYFIVMAACLQGLFTADLDEAFPHYYNIRYFVVHCGLVQSILYAIFVYGFRPKAKHILYAFGVFNIYLGLMHLINLAIGTNFVYTVTKPPKTVLDLFGEHYILYAEPFCLLLFAIVYIPIAIGRQGFESRKG